MISVRRHGFTLIELMVAISIVVLLTAAGLVSFIQAGKTSRDNKRLADLEQLRSALVLYRVDEGAYPAEQPAKAVPYTELAPYISGATPADPKNVSPYIYSYELSGKLFYMCAKMEAATLPASCVPRSGLCCVTNP